MVFMLVIISYDIEDDKTRTRLAHQLKDFGPRVQFSVFEADISESELRNLNKMLGAVALAKDDSIRLYRICESCAAKIKIWGSGKVTQDQEYYIH
jgi:CRISPR-associated protein Cas2